MGTVINSRIRAIFRFGGVIAILAFLLQSAGDHRNPVVEDRALTGSFATQLGEHRRENLPDGTAVLLNTNTFVRYAFDQHGRHVELVSGEAAFLQVPKDAGRPFDVRSGGVVVRDIGTSFDVYRKRASTLVTVIEGRVKVAGTAPLGSGSDAGDAESAWKSAPVYQRLQQIEFDEATQTLHERRSLTEQRLSQLLSWQRGRLDLNRMTLEQALAEFSRYQPIDTFRYQDPSLRSIRMGGELGATNLMDFLDSLEHVFNIHHIVTKGSDGKTLVTFSGPRNIGDRSKGK